MGSWRVLIVGSGPVGAVYARLLVEAGHHVTMLESGAVLSEPPGDHLANAFVHQQTPNLFMDNTAAAFETFSVPTGIFRRRRGKYRRNYENPKQKLFRSMPFASAVYAVGGMSTVWTASCPAHADFELPSVLPVEEWRDLIDMSDELLGVNTETFAASGVGAAVKERLDRRRRNRPFHQLPVAVSRAERTDEVRWTGSSAILGPLLENPEQFELLSEHRVELLQHSDGVVTGVDARNLQTDEVRTFTADVVIVSAGSFLTPRLLWQSGIRPRALGHYLHDHTQSGVRISLKRSILERLRADKDNPARTEPLPISHDAIPPMLGIEPTPKRPWHGQMHASGKKFLYTGGEDVRRILDISYYGMVTPRYKNHISFSETLQDRFGQPQITVDFRWSGGDVWRMLRMWWDMIRTVRKVGKLKSIPIISPPGTTLHLMGTCRMGTEDQKDESVADTSSKVWGFENLYLGGLGLIPDRNASNPTNVACAMAVRAVATMTDKTVQELRDAHRSAQPSIDLTSPPRTPV